MSRVRSFVNIEKRNLSLLLFVIVVTLGLLAASRYNYLLFHVLAEGFSIIIAGAMFVLVWNTWSLTEHGYLKFLGIAFLSVGSLDLVHTMAYKGMNIFSSYESNLPTQLWIAARYVQAVSLLIAPTFRHRKLRKRDRYLIAGMFALITTALLVLIFARLFPDCYLEGQGLTPFKIFSEYIISILLLIAGLHLYHRRDDFTTDIFLWLVAAIVFTILSELAFTFYISVYGFSNLIGHIFKICAFYCLYHAIIETGLRKPYALLFSDLEQRNAQLAREVTERKRTEQELKQYQDHLEELVQQRTEALTEAQQRLAEQERLAALGEFAGGIAHDLRQPLSVITNVGYLLKLYLSDPDDKVVEYMDMLKEEADYANRIIHDLLEFARTGQVRAESVAIPNLVSAVIDKHPPPEHITTEIHYPDDLPAAHVDPGHIRQVLTNLVENAYHAMPEGGSLTISMGVDQADIAIAITDTGIGISSDKIKKIFEPLFTTKKKGVGLGLAIGKKLVEANGGRLEVKSKPKKGTTFTLRLPIRKDNHEQAN